MRKLLILLIFSTVGLAQDPVSITPYQLIDASTGVALPCVGCYIDTYRAGTNTPLAVYVDSTITTQNTNPVRTNAAGYAVDSGGTITGIWVGSSCYKFRARNAVGVTMWTQDNICDQALVLKALLAGSTGASLIGYTLGATGSVVTTVQAELRQKYELKVDFGAAGDNTTNDTAATIAAVKAAASANAALHAAAGRYRVCDASPTGLSSNNVTIYGDGMFNTTFVPFGGSAGCGTGPGVLSKPLISISTLGAVNLRDFGTDGERAGQTDFSGNNILITGPGTSNDLEPPSSITLSRIYTANSKSVGIGIQPGKNISYTDSISENNYFFAFSAASSGTTATPKYVNNVSVSGIVSINESIGVGLNFFLRDCSITGSVFRQSGIIFSQMPSSNCTITGNTFDGVPTRGCYFDATCGTIAGSWAPIAFEGISQWTVGPNYAVNINGAAAVLIANGSRLEIPGGGTEMELPTSHGHVTGLVIADSTAGFPLVIGGRSNGANPVEGVDISVKSSVLSNVNECINVGSAIGVEISGNYCNGATNGGILVGSVQNGTVKNNTCRNCNSAAGTIYTTGTLTATNGSATLAGSSTVWISGMVGGGITIAGTTYQIASRSSNTSIDLTVPYIGATAAGLTYSIKYNAGGTYPGLSISGGTHNLQVNGNTFQNDSGNRLSVAIDDSTGIAPATSGIRYDTTNTCTGGCGAGIISPVPSRLPAITGGTSPAIASYSTNEQGLVIAGTAGPTSLTLTFANSGFNDTPTCNFTPGTLDIAVRGGGTSGTQYVWGIGGAAMTSQVWQYSCRSASGSASAGWYPYPQQ